MGRDHPTIVEIKRGIDVVEQTAGMGDDLTFIAYCDLSGLVRGRAIRSVDAMTRLSSGVGWVPADQSITPFGSLGAENPYGPLGDLRLDPDMAPAATWTDERGTLAVHLSSASYPDGGPFDACPRHALRSALDDLESEVGCIVRASFEHEFTVLGGAPAPSFTLRGFRELPWLHDLASAVGAENVLSEFGPGQYEVTLPPTIGMAAADAAVALREQVRELARRHGQHATFSPIVDPAGVGNGVHVHLSLESPGGAPLTHDPQGEAGLSSLMRLFVGGIIDHLPALVAFTAPSAISSLRLTPHRWSAGFACSGVRNREAAVRICPGVAPGGWNVEFRAADAAACPHLVLAALVRAGLSGIRNGLSDMRLIDVDPSDLTDQQREARGIRPLPHSLGAAVDALESDSEAMAWFPPLLTATYLEMKRTELADVAELSEAERCARYAEVY